MKSLRISSEKDNKKKINEKFAIRGRQRLEANLIKKQEELIADHLKLIEEQNRRKPILNREQLFEEQFKKREFPERYMFFVVDD